MARPKNPKAGRGPCPGCGEPVLFRLSPATQRLSYSCDQCDHSAYADPGGARHAAWSKAMTKAEPDEPAKSEPKPKDTAPAARSGGFNLANL